ncbi:CoA-binding protein [Agrobacterium tumefaciens]|uniref:acetate--CoA ligase family protein n=1 Tax=Agrobacterium tumefaciens TaxID=358 RepID=UPI001573F723|nr:acetate--CoA ligase [Agrobacterium tumefaciens]NTE68276.1 CoA-binding protein [Agrobacterium tumefaciens]
MFASLQDILYPNAIAVIGASKDVTKRGFRSIEKLLEDGYLGAIYPINPKETEILGIPCFASIADVPGAVDLLLVCTPAKSLPGILRDCMSRGIKGAVVLAGGFAEAGEEGKILQAAMLEAAREAGVRIIGPNTSGVFNTYKKCNVVGFSNLRSGPIGLLSQSGNMALSLVTEAQANGHIGLSTYIGIGNEADVRFDEYLDYFRQDENTKVVIAYVEGVKDGRRFLDALRRITRVKPVVVYKSGRTSAGHSAAKSHTGALAGDYAVSQGVLTQAGAVLARNSDEILSIAEALSLLPPLSGRRLAVLADGGGHATIAADAMTEQLLSLADLSENTRRRLEAILPPAASLANPVDVAGGTDANPAVFADCARILLEDANVDGLLITGLYGGYGIRFSSSLTPIELTTTERIAALSAELGKPIVVHSLYGALDANQRPLPLTRLREAGIPVHDSLEVSVRCLRALADFGEARSSARENTSVSKTRQGGFEDLLTRCRAEGRSVVLENEGRAVLEAEGVAMAPSIMAKSASEAASALEALGNVPVAMKIVSRDILHKTDAGGVKLNINASRSASEAFDDIVRNAHRHVETPDIAGVLVTPMAEKGGVEVIVGVVRDPMYGPVMMFGLGGVLVEVLRDVSFRSIPLSRDDAHAMLDQIKAKSLLDGARGALPVDRDAIVDLMVKVSDLITAFPEIAELDLNPVLAYSKGLSVLDVRILLSS